MADTKHTPGPWSDKSIAIAHVYHVHSKRTIANCGGYTDNTDDGKHIIENEANAQLIAAAPDLLEALEYVLVMETDPKLIGLYGGYTLDDDVRDKITEALTKAKGGQSNE